MRSSLLTFQKAPWFIALTGRSPLRSGVSAICAFHPRAVPKTLMTRSGVESAFDKHLVLVSGGVESSTVLHRKANQANGSVTALFVHYGQRAVTQERRAVQAQCEACNVSDLVELDLQSVGEAFAKRAGKERRFVPLPHRNLVLLALATSLADMEKIANISVAISKDDEGWYPSAGSSFLTAFRTMAEGLNESIHIEAPLIHMTKAEIIKLGKDLGVDFGMTWSCMVGRGSVHCGRCIQCRARKEAFFKAGFKEAENFYAR